MQKTSEYRLNYKLTKNKNKNKKYNLNKKKFK